ncbi:molybdenum cofactor biosynthesis protein C [Candidatus Epulonipiscium fishelsonii]|nr:molybdenum cofactor biosynthesis protein C [Epulopiscium sp. SCG-C06WGA-EpuloA1]
MSRFSHFDDAGNAIMVDVSDKDVTTRIAVACGSIKVNNEVIQSIKNKTAKKGDVLGVARVAGIMGVKQTSNLIPMCHPLLISKTSIDFEIDEEQNIIMVECSVKIEGKTGVEMEALNGVTTALLTIYDMCKAVDKEMIIQNILLKEKMGGRSGHYRKQ